MTQKQNDPQNNKQEEAVKDQQETFQETNEQKNASAPLEADCQSGAKHQDETSRRVRQVSRERQASRAFRLSKKKKVQVVLLVTPMRSSVQRLEMR